MNHKFHSWWNLLCSYQPVSGILQTLLETKNFIFYQATAQAFFAQYLQILLLYWHKNTEGMDTFSPTSGGFSQAQKSATKKDGNVHRNTTHPQVLILCLNLNMQVQSLHVNLEICPFITVFNHRNEADNRRLGTTLPCGLVFVDATSFRNQNKIKLNLGLCCSWLLDF